MNDIEVFVGQIVTAGESNLAVDDCDFSMIPVIHEEIQNRCHRIKDPAADPRRIHFPNEGPVDKTNTAHIIIKQPDIHPGRCLSRRMRLISQKGLGILDGEIFHEDKLLGTCQFPLQIIKSP